MKLRDYLILIFSVGIAISGVVIGNEMRKIMVDEHNKSCLLLGLPDNCNEADLCFKDCNRLGMSYFRYFAGNAFKQSACNCRNNDVVLEIWGGGG